MTPWPGGLHQPNQQTCGASVLVVARMVNDPGYRNHVGSPTDFVRETLAMHRRVTSSADVLGHLQLPWPRALGTPPWAVAHQMSGSSGISGARYSTRVVLPGRRPATLAGIRDAVSAGHVVPLFVGNRWLPRHVVLVLDDDLNCYDPASGRLIQMVEQSFLRARLSISGWSHPWFAVLPD